MQCNKIEKAQEQSATANFDEIATSISRLLKFCAKFVVGVGLGLR
jgi:hypothetical protein